MRFVHHKELSISKRGRQISSVIVKYKMNTKMDPMGRAIADYWKNKKAGRLRVFSPMFEEDEIPLTTLF